MVALGQARLHSPQDLIQRIHYYPARKGGEGYRDSNRQLCFHFLFILRFKRYLSLPGHPDHPDVQQCIDSSKMTSESSNPVLRGLLLLDAITDRTTLPPKGAWTLSVRFPLQTLSWVLIYI